MMVNATVIGSKQSIEAIAEYVGYLPNEYNKEFSQLIREICVYRGYLGKVESKKMKVYRFLYEDFQRLTDKNEILMEILKKGLPWTPEVFVEYKKIAELINAVDDSGELSNQISHLDRVKRISDELGMAFNAFNQL